MTEEERKLLRAFIGARENTAITRLRHELRYVEVCRQQEASGEAADALLHKLEKDERIQVRRHFEGDMARINIEMDAVYLQGVRDGVRLVSHLDAPEREVWL